MRHLLRLSFALATALAAASVTSNARAEARVLSNDGFEDGDSVAFQQGFATGESAGATLGPVSGTFQVNKLQFLYGPAGADVTVTVTVYADDDASETPTNLIYSGQYTVTPADDGIEEIDLSAEHVIHQGPGSIRVAVMADHDGAPGVARDADGCTPARNWIAEVAPPSWQDACDLGVPGDWVIRAEIDGPPDVSGTGGGGAGGGAVTVGSGGAGGEGGAGGGASGGLTGGGADGCGCVAVGRSSDQRVGLAIAALGVLVAMSRRRRRSAATR